MSFPFSLFILWCCIFEIHTVRNGFLLIDYTNLLYLYFHYDSCSVCQKETFQLLLIVSVRYVVLIVFPICTSKI